jgi:hypothetical protein
MIDAMNFIGLDNRGLCIILKLKGASPCALGEGILVLSHIDHHC